MEIQISVRRLVEFILRSGDIDNRKRAGTENAMLEGSRIHRMIQKSMGAEYTAEVSLSHKIVVGEYTIVIDGRADGIMNDSLITVDEIKGTYRKLDKMNEPVPIHLAQAKCYAYIYATQNNIDRIRVRMTYCNIETEEIRYFYETYQYEALSDWFTEVISKYMKWTDFHYSWVEKRQSSIKKLEFPY